MPRADSGDVELVYGTDGNGETVAFVGDVGFGAWQWGWQHAAVAGPFESLVYDHRGTGRSDAPPGPYTVETLAADLEAVLADHGAGRVHLVGAGLGGLVALRHAREFGRAVTTTLLGTAADTAGVDPMALWAPRSDPGAVRESVRRSLSTAFCEAQPDVIEGIVEWRREEDAAEAGWRAQAAAVASFEPAPLYELTLPALVVHGTDDAVWPAERGQRLAADLPRGEFLPFDGAGHLVHVERSRAVNDRLLGFLEANAATD